jgi:uncharacterized membrane protein
MVGLLATLVERLLESVSEAWVLGLAIVAALVAVAVYVAGRIRAKAAQQEPTASDLLSKCRELHARGELSDAEFRTIKTTVAPRLQEELKGDGNKG